jgi:hypothetical protein
MLGGRVHSKISMDRALKIIVCKAQAYIYLFIYLVDLVHVDKT